MDCFGPLCRKDNASFRPKEVGAVRAQRLFPFPGRIELEERVLAKPCEGQAAAVLDRKTILHVTPSSRTESTCLKVKFHGWKKGAGQKRRPATVLLRILDMLLLVRPNRGICLKLGADPHPCPGSRAIHTRRQLIPGRCPQVQHTAKDAGSYQLDAPGGVSSEQRFGSHAYRIAALRVKVKALRSLGGEKKFWGNCSKS